MKFRLRMAAAVLILGTGTQAAAQTHSKTESFEPSGHYQTRQVQGWTIRFNAAILAEKDGFSEKVFELLNQQLFQVVRKVPAAALAKLKTVTIWLELNEPHHPCMAYHPDKGWLIEHGMNPHKARCVEIANARNFLSWTLEQPWMVLHELAHAYHDQFLPDGFENRRLKERFQAARTSKIYRNVLHYNGKEEVAYAETNPMEYFAEASEAFFGENDFYPFVRAELKRHDPQLESAVAELWSRP